MMGESIGQVLVPAVGVALSASAIVAVVIMLGTPRARSNGLSFLAGWVLGLLVVGAVVLVMSGGVGASGAGSSPPTWVFVIKLILGVALVLLAAFVWRRRTAEDSESFPGWMRAVDTFSPMRSAVTAALLSGANPKNLLLTVSAALAIAQTGASASEQAVALVIFAVIGTFGPGVPVAIYFSMGDRANRLLSALKSWMASHNSAIMIVLCLVIAAKLIGDAVTGLTS